jgi:Helix-turn-helix
VEALRFLGLIAREPFDYQEWRRKYFSQYDMAELLIEVRKHHGSKSPSTSGHKHPPQFSFITTAKRSTYGTYSPTGKTKLIPWPIWPKPWPCLFTLMKRPVPKIAEATGPEVLKSLMEEHGLRQSDLPEIGSQGAVSEILSGARELNVRQLRRLAKRFGVSPAVFINAS